MSYLHAWKVRKIQLIIVNVVFAVLGVLTAIEGNIIGGFTTWIFGAWIVGTFLASFTKTGDRISRLAYTIGATMFSGVMSAATEGGPFFVVMFAINLVKAFFGCFVLAAVLAFEFVAYPFTTINYFIKSRQEAVMA